MRLYKKKRGISSFTEMPVLGMENKPWFKFNLRAVSRLELSTTGILCM